MHRWNGDGDYIGQASCTIFDLSNPKSSNPGALNAAPVYITDIHWFPMPPGRGQNAASETYAAAGTDGKLYFCSKAGRVEKIVDGHKGAVLAVKWNYEGTALVTAGEDGNLKIWSRTGMLRSGLVSSGYPIYSVAWSPDNDSILYTNGRNLVVKPIQPASKPLSWKAHDEVILKVDWNMATNLIISGGEDCRYKVWDSYGRQIYSSAPHDHPVTSLAWNPTGEMFAVGLFNTLRVCDKLGWSYAVEKPECGSIFNIAWTPDGTQVACAGGNGAVVFGHVIDRRLEWKNYEVTLMDDRKIRVHEVVHGAVENLEFRDRVVKASLSFGHLIVATYAQCYIYSEKNWNTPVIIDMSNNGRVICIKQSPDYFLFVDNSTGIQVFTYEGRLVCSPKYPGLRPDFITSQSISLANDTLAIKDKTDEKSIYLFELSTGRLMNGGAPLKLQTEAIEIGLNQVIGPGGCRQLAVLDKNREMFLTPVLKPDLKKIGTMVDTFSWNDEADMIAAIVDWKFMVWYYPNVVFIDSDIESMTRFERDGAVFGKNAQFTSFNGTQCTLRRADGALITANNISPLPAMLQEIVKKKQWEEAIRLCRFAKMQTLWACLAAMSVSGQDLNTAELSYAAIDQVQKVQYICYIRDIPTQEGRAAELALLRKQTREAEAILVSAGFIYRAIMLNVNLFRWERALELAVKHKTHVDTVLYFRDKYLRHINRKETIKAFIQYGQGISVDWDKIKAKMDMEESSEKNRGRGKGSNENLKAVGNHERTKSSDSRKSARDDNLAPPNLKITRNHRPTAQEWMSATLVQIIPSELPPPAQLAFSNLTSTVFGGTPSNSREYAAEPSNEPQQGSVTASSIRYSPSPSEMDYFESEIWNDQLSLEASLPKLPSSLRFQDTNASSTSTQTQSLQRGSSMTTRERPAQISTAQSSSAKIPHSHATIMKIFDRKMETNSTTTLFEFIGEFFKSLPKPSAKLDSIEVTLPSSSQVANLAVFRHHGVSESSTKRSSFHSIENASPTSAQPVLQRPSVRRQRISFYNRNVRSRYYFSDENDVTKVDGHSEVESKLEAETVTTVTEENVTEAEYSSEVDVSGSLNETIPRIEENYDGWKSFLEWRDGIELDVTASSVDVGPVADADHDLFENNSHDGFSIFAIRLYDSDELESTADDDDSNCDNLENTKEAEQVEVSDDQAACPSHTMDLESILAAFPEAVARRPASLKGVPITQTSPIRCSASFHEPRFRSVSEPADHAPAIWRDVPLAFFKSGVHLSVQNFHITKPKHSTLVPQVLSDEHYTEYCITVKLLRPRIVPFGNTEPCSHQLNRRYSQFRSLFVELTKVSEYQTFKWPDFPKKTYLGTYLPIPRFNQEFEPFNKFSSREVQFGGYFATRVCIFSASQFYRAATADIKLGARAQISRRYSV
ncbi:hypothetical protein CcCBS67573_g09888 [Chytriomyces confervae]|uniref:Uncharacterized protein n=1 Tax=Chytriomyces confervae TaxID=246404 RepID=A0A507DNB7_9FUNG|nr:hypothetical protein CcCBS67573_g09888 [Chytriomyces confervae]